MKTENTTIVSGMTYSVTINLPKVYANVVINEINNVIDSIIENHYSNTIHATAIYEAISYAIWKNTCRDYPGVMVFNKIEK